jgi:hypothetical protein
MADESVIKKFLVTLGFKTDESALKKFGDGIDRATKSVFLLATAVSATATTVAIGVERFAANMEKLYFAAYRTGTSATHIKAFERTIQDFGGTAEGAMSAIEGLTTFLRNNPAGGSGMINQWLAGVGKHLTGDKAVDLASIGELFAKNTREGNARLNDQLASQWGISSETALQIQMAGFGDRQQATAKRLEAAGFAKATDDAKNFMRALRETGDWLTIIGAKVGDVLLTKLGFSMGKLNEYLAKNGDAIADKIVHGVEVFIHLLEVMAPIVMAIIHAFEWLDKVTGGLSTTIIGVMALMSAFGGFKILSGIWKVGEALFGLVTGYRAIGTAAEAAATAARAAAAAEHFGRANALGNEVLAHEARALAAGTEAEVIEAMASSRVAAAEATAARQAGKAALIPRVGRLAAAGALASKLSGIGTAVWLGYELGDTINDLFPNGPLAKAGEGVSRGVDWYRDKVNAKQGYAGADPAQMLAAMGWSKEQSAGILANLQVESASANLNPDAYGAASKGEGRGMPGEAYGIAQWHKDRQANFAKVFPGRDIHGSSREEQLQFVDWELRHSENRAGDAIRQSANARESANFMNSLYERSTDRSSLRGDKAEGLMGRSVHMDVKTDIHIGHADDSTAREIQRVVDNTHREAQRALQMTVQ